MYVYYTFYILYIVLYLTFTLCLCFQLELHPTAPRIIFLFPHFLQQACLSFNISCTLPSFLSARSLFNTLKLTTPACVLCTLYRQPPGKMKSETFALFPPACLILACLLLRPLLLLLLCGFCSLWTSLFSWSSARSSLPYTSTYLCTHVCMDLCMHSNLINKSMNATMNATLR